jgi:hypothetical protein
MTKVYVVTGLVEMVEARSGVSGPAAYIPMHWASGQVGVFQVFESLETAQANNPGGFLILEVECTQRILH